MKMRRLFAWAGTSLVLSAGLASAQGLTAPTGGAMHSGMAGTSTAVGVDAVSALFWNPAVISGLPHSEVTIGSQLIIPHLGVTSTVPAGAFGPILGPADTLSGRTNSDSGLVPTTAIGVVYHSESNPRLTYGLGINTVASGGVNYPGDPNNPVLAPTGPLNQFILGPQVAGLSVLQIAPTASYQVTDSFAVGFSPIVNVMSVLIDPALFATPSQVRPIDPLQFPNASSSRPFWGGGFRAGVTYRATQHVTAGFSYTSPQWFETWEFNTRDANGDGFTLRQPFSLPQIFSTGVAYDGIDCLLLAADLRYLDYSTTKLLGEPVRDGGAGWDSIWAVSLGAKYQLTERVSLLGGYLYNQNPVPEDLALFNIQLPCITEHTLTCGAYAQVTDNIGMSVGYMHGFENKVSGSVVQLLGTSTTLDTKFDALVFGLHIKFGGPRCRTNGCPCDAPPVLESGTIGQPAPANLPVSVSRS
jgi:long-chain fatty acid transport protein